jgi:hypothetical protein
VGEEGMESEIVRIGQGLQLGQMEIVQPHHKDVPPTY